MFKLVCSLWGCFMSDEEENQRSVPVSDLDFQSQITSPVWGKRAPITKELHKELCTLKIVKHYKKGDVRVNPETQQAEIVNADVSIEEEFDEWGKLGYLTQDFRLSNLNPSEKSHCVENQDLALAFLQFGCPKSFLTCTGENANLMEISQSQGGWLRHNMNTLRTENKSDITQKEDKGGFFNLKR